MLSVQELIDIVIMSLLLGFLFKDVIKFQSGDVLDRYRNKRNNFWYATAIIAPSVILHELAHKFVAISFGLHATFHAFYANSTTLFLGIIAIIAKLTGFGFVFLVPGFVEIIGPSTPVESMLIAFAGPLMHGLFYIGCIVYTKLKKELSEKETQIVYITKYVNGFLFILNMLPIPGIDGFAIYTSLFEALGI